MNINQIYNIPSQSQQNKFSNNYSINNISILTEITKRLTKSARDQMNRHISFDNNEVPHYESQATMAAIARKSRKTSNRSSKKLDQLNLVTKIYRHRKTSLYIVNPVLRNPLVRIALKDIFPSLRVFHISYIQESYASKLLEREIKQNVPPLLNDMLNNGYGYSYSSQKREKRMQASEWVPSATLKKVEEALCLTKAGVMGLSCFDDNTLAYALKSYQGNKVSLENPYRWFCATAKNYAIKQQRSVNYRLMNELEEKNGISRDTVKWDKELYENRIREKREKKQSQEELPPNVRDELPFEEDLRLFEESWNKKTDEQKEFLMTNAYIVLTPNRVLHALLDGTMPETEMTRLLLQYPFMFKEYQKARKKQMALENPTALEQIAQLREDLPSRVKSLADVIKGLV